MEGRLCDRIALVTGASRGIGRAIAVNLAEEGATVVIVARTAAPSPGSLGNLERVAVDIKAAGGRAVPIAIDLLQSDSVSRLADEVAARAGRVDVLVNNAAYVAYAAFHSFEATGMDEWRAQIELNLTVPFALMKAFAPGMVAAGGGRIVNLISASGYIYEVGKVPVPGAGGVGAAYGASKAGLLRLTNAVANELHAANVAVTAVDPGSTVTENRADFDRRFGFTPATHGPEVPARTVRYLAACSDPMTYTGTLVVAAEFAAQKGLA